MYAIIIVSSIIFVSREAFGGDGDVSKSEDTYPVSPATHVRKPERSPDEASLSRIAAARGYPALLSRGRLFEYSGRHFFGGLDEAWDIYRSVLRMRFGGYGNQADNAIRLIINHTSAMGKRVETMDSSIASCDWLMHSERALWSCHNCK